MSGCGSRGKCKPETYSKTYSIRTFAGYELTVDKETDVVLETTYHVPSLVIGHRILGVVHVDSDFTDKKNYIDWDLFRTDIFDFGFSVNHISGRPEYTILLLVIDDQSSLVGSIVCLSPGPFGVAEVSDNIYLN